MEKTIERNRVVCTDWYESEEYMWMCLADRNAICKVEKETGKVHVLGYYPRDNMTKRLLCNKVVRNGNMLVFVPYCASDIALLNLESDELFFVSIQTDDSEKMAERGKFTQAFVRGDYVYFFGLWYPVIIRLNPFTKEILYLESLKDEVEAPYVSLGQAVFDEKVIMPIGSEAYFLEFYFCEGKIETKKSIDVEGSFFSMTKEKNNVWITSGEMARKVLLRWDSCNNVFEQISLAEEGLYYEPIIYEKDIYLFPHCGKSILRVNIDNKICSICEELSLTVGRGDWANVMAVKQIGNKVKYVTGGSRNWYEYDLDSKKLKRYCYEIDDAENEQSWNDCMIEKIKNAKSIIKEREILLSEYLTFLRTGEDGSYSEENKCGDMVLKVLKGM
ncbi:MAG: hypothetical protein IJZ76_00465 [Lachnospiraceae bacterium]|nr:hypothetical protein [Lachnospiraceae bacterium]